MGVPGVGAGDDQRRLAGQRDAQALRADEEEHGPVAVGVDEVGDVHAGATDDGMRDSLLQLGRAGRARANVPGATPHPAAGLASQSPRSTPGRHSTSAVELGAGEQAGLILPAASASGGAPQAPPAGRYDLWLADPETGAASFRQRRFEPPPGAAELVLIRHGESEAYVDGRPFPLACGHGDPPLSPQGLKQAGLVSARLGAAGIDAIYVTTLRRTAQTAAPLASRLGLDPRVEAGLREVHLGDWEGGIYRKMMTIGHPVSQQVLAEERWDLIPGAEPAAAFADRVRAAIVRVAAGHLGQRVAVFTHGGVIGQALALASGSRPFAFVGADNASISRLVIAAREPGVADCRRTGEAAERPYGAFVHRLAVGADHGGVAQFGLARVLTSGKHVGVYLNGR